MTCDFDSHIEREGLLKVTVSVTYTVKVVNLGNGAR